MSDKKPFRFTDNSLKGLKPKDERYTVYDGRGLGVRVSPSGTKTFIIIYRFDGKRQQLTIGEYPAYSLADANQKHLEVKQAIARNEDPSIERPKDMPDLLVKDLIKTFLESHGVNLAARTLSDYQKELDLYVIPKIGKLPVRSVRRGDGIMLLDNMVRAGQRSAANRVKAYLTKIWNWALDRNYIEEMPFHRLPKPVIPVARKRFLSEEEIAKFWYGLEVIKSKRTRAALRLCLILGRRELEMVGARRDEFDLEHDLWILPKDRPGRKLRERNIGNEDDLLIPLPKLAKDIIKERLDSQSVFPHLFPSETDPVNQHHKPEALSRALLRRQSDMGFDKDPFTPHDLRRTASTHMSRIGISQEIIDKILGHKATGVRAVYNRNDYLDQKRAALLAWEKELIRILEKFKPDTPNSGASKKRASGKKVARPIS